MFLTLFYMYATVLQWYRLSNLRNKLSGTLNSKNALLVCDESVIYDTKKSKSFENLLFKNKEKVGCTVVPKDKINLSQWLTFPKESNYFPIYFDKKLPKLEYPHIYILIQAMLETYVKHSADILQIENYGELVAWRASETFDAILKSDLHKLTLIVHRFSIHNVDINHELKLLRIETVDVEGFPIRIKYDRTFSKESVLKYSYAPVYWKKFADTTKEIYAKIRDTKNPKIMIESGKSEEKKVPVSEVKPIKKDGKRSEDKNTLEVGSGDYRRHKSGEHRRDKNTEKHKSDNAKGEASTKSKDERRQQKSEERHKHKEETKDGDSHKREKEEKRKEKSKKESTPNEEPPIVKITKETKDKHHKKEDKKDLLKKTKSNLEKSSDIERKPDKVLSKRSSSDKKLVKSAALCEDVELNSKQKPKKSKEHLDVTVNGGKSGDSPKNGRTHTASSEIRKTAKPPNILIYADSLVAKDNVKTAFINMLNKEKYVIYDLPTDPKQTMWNDSTVLVVVCGNVPPNLTSHLLEYLLGGGQLLCLCSDFLYSVLHTFTTAEVREHELVRFSYGQWQQVKMMHHIFCYQASPTKKQFSKESDHSNQSSGNGSSPVAPRTPSVVEVQHNGKDHVIQVQVLGTEETWQTPSLMLATVKGGKGRAIFSQVHLEINPDQFEDDETKFNALKDSDQARMEILKDILVNHLEIDCTVNKPLEYTPGYFLGRHDLKLKLLKECEDVKDMRMDCGKIVLKFCGKDEKPEPATAAFMPISIHTCPSNFSTVTYFEELATEHVGRLVIYADVMTSSQLLLEKPLAHGMVVIPRQQTSGVGRSNNRWISPDGCAAFSLQIFVPTQSPLGAALPLIQHLTMVAVVAAIKNQAGGQDLDIGIKWPNDLYAYRNIKIGGLTVKSVMTDSKILANIGVGVNLDNSNPTTCINDIIRKSNETKGTSIKLIPYEVYFASVFNEFEKIFQIVQNGDLDYFYDLYYKYWLHHDSDVKVATSPEESVNMKIVGIDEYGFLKVRSPEGEVSTIHPDGNTFDMLQGLISRKMF